MSTSITIKEEYASICRICLKDDPTDRHTIFDELLKDGNKNAVDERFNQIHYFLMSFTDIKVEKDDGLPYRICGDCLYLTQSAFNLYKLCNESQKHFITLSESSVVNVDETENVSLSDLVPLNNLNAELKANPDDFNITEKIIETTLSSLETMESDEGKFDCTDPDVEKVNLQRKSKRIPVLSTNPTIIESNRKPGELETNPDVKRPIDIEGNYTIKLVNNKKKFACNKCGNSFSEMTYLKRHYSLHLDPFYVCKHCQKTFNSQRMFKLHSEIHSEERYTCELCGKTYKSKQVLREHYNLHNNVRYKCTKCDKSFYRRTQLYLHQKSHSDARPNICLYCGAAFKSKGNLRCHERTHTGEKKHQCDQCDKAFSELYGLKRHKWVHMTNVPLEHKCDQCDKSYKTIRYLRQHKQSHAEKRHQCRICLKKYTQIGSMRSHMRFCKGPKASTSSEISAMNVDEAESSASNADETETSMEISAPNLDETEMSATNMDEAETPTITENENIPNVNMDDMDIKTETFFNSEDPLKTSTESSELVQLNNLTELTANSDEINNVNLATINVNDAEMLIKTENEIKIETENNDDADAMMVTTLELLDNITSSPCNSNTELMPNFDDFNKVIMIKEETDDEFKTNPNVERKSEQVNPLKRKRTTEIKSNKKPGELETNPEVTRTVNVEGKYTIKIIDNKKKLECNECGTSFFVLTRLKRHYSTHLDDFYICTQCQKTFKSQRMFKTHLDTHSETRYPCELCGKSYKSKRVLREHSYVHKNIRFECPICGRTFARRAELFLHKRTHSNARPYICLYCGTGFKSKSNLSVHEKTHTGEKRHQCDQCDKAFNESYGLKRHKATHVHNRPRSYECDKCNKCFKTRNNLRQHMQMHTDKKYQCNLCSRKFVQARTLKSHVKACSGPAE